MGLEYWNVKIIPDEVYLGWNMFYESKNEIGQTTGMFSTRGRAIKDGKELVFFDPSIKNQHKVMTAIKKKVKNFIEYTKQLEENS